MEIDKAIKILTIHNDHNPDFTDAERREAHQLGIEALKRLDYCRSGDFDEPFELLPGETHEEDTIDKLEVREVPGTGMRRFGIYDPTKRDFVRSLNNNRVLTRDTIESANRLMIGIVHRMLKEK